MKYAWVALRFADVTTEAIAEFESIAAVDILDLIVADYNKNVKAEFVVDKSAVSIVENVNELLQMYSSHFMECGEEVDAEQILEMESDTIHAYEMNDEEADHYVLVQNH